MTIRIKTRPKSYYDGTKALDGASYLFRFHWNIETAKWYMNVDGLNNDVSMHGLALLPGKDIFSISGYGGQLGQLWVVDHTNPDNPENPNYDDMGTRWTLEYTPIDG